MELNKIKYERTTSIISFLFVLSVFVTSIALVITHMEPPVLVPFSHIVIPVIHGVCSILCFILIFKFNYPIFFAMLQLESVIAILTEFPILGIFFYYISIFLLFIIYYQTRPVKYIVTVSFILHLLFVSITYKHGWPKLIVNFFTSFFMLFIYLWLYNLLKARFACFKPSMIMNNSTIGEKIPGTILSLSSYKLTERQINLTLDYINNNLSYNDLSSKYYVSLSTVKKEFADIFKIFGVTKNDELKLLLLQYIVEK